MPELPFTEKRGVPEINRWFGAFSAVHDMIQGTGSGKKDGQQENGHFHQNAAEKKNLTQRELAEQLHITDRAVSKWERGLCAPDLSLLEPLAEALNTSVLELIEGERTERARESEKSAKTVLEYSKGEVAHKVKRAEKRYLGILGLCLAAVLVLCALLLWRGGYLFIVDRSVSPDKTASATVYRKKLTGNGFSIEDATSLIVKKGDGDGTWRITYGNSTYQGLWWAPDGRKYVLSLQCGGSTQLVLAWLDQNSESNLSAYLSLGVEMTELSKYGYTREGAFPEIEYQFLQWGLDSESMLIYYSFSDKTGKRHEGYFWYNCETGTVSAILELARPHADAAEK